jgi:hypothetical protein
METPCEYHTMLVSDLAVIKNDISYIKEKVCGHIREGEKEGGFRDRVVLLEERQKKVLNEIIPELKRRFWFSSLIGGVLGALIGSGSGDIVGEFFKWIMNIH